MKKLLPISLFISVISFSLVAQPSIQWQKCLGGTGDEYGTSIQQTTDGGYIVVGSSWSNDGDVASNHHFPSEEYWIVKLSNLGVIQWQKCFGGTGRDGASAVQQTTDGGYIVAGSSDSNDGDVTGHHYSADYWVVKLTSTGVIQWQKSLGGAWPDQLYSVQQTTDGGYILAGISSSTDGDVTGNHGHEDYWVVKLNSLGATEWQKSLGGTLTDWAWSIQQTADGGYIVAGSAYSNDGDVIGNQGGTSDYWIVKLTNTGAIQWQKCLGGTGGDEANSIQLTSDGGYIVAGSSNSNDGDVTGNHGSWDYWVVKLNSLGAIEWQKSLGGSQSDVAQSVHQTTDGGYIVVGGSSSADGDVIGHHGANNYNDNWMVKLSNIGVIQWQKSLGGSKVDYASAVQQTSDGGYIVAGSSNSNDGDVTGHHGANNYNDYWVVKLSSGIGILEISNTLSNLLITPNPVSQSTSIFFSLSQTENLSVTVYDITGRLVKNLFTGSANKGNHELKWNISTENRIDDGVYFLNFVGAGFTNSSKIVVVK